MAIPNWQRTIVNDEGQVVPNAEIQVVNEATSLNADLYSDRDGAVPIANPFFATSEGFAEFYTDPGVYRITATGPGGSITWRYENIMDQATDNVFTGDNTHTGEEDFTGQVNLGDVEITGEVTGDHEVSGAVDYTGSTTGPVGLANGKFPLELFTLAGNVRAVSASFPAVCLDAITTATTIDEANYPDIVSDLRAIKTTYNEGKATEADDYSVTNWDVTGSVATLTLDDDDAENALLLALAEDNLVHGSYTNWRTITLPADIGNVLAGDYAITDVDPVTREIQFAAAVADGSGAVTAVCEFYPHRIAGSSTTARLFECSGRAIVSAGTTEDFSGLRQRDQMQRTIGTFGATTSASGSSGIGLVRSDSSILSGVFSVSDSGTTAGLSGSIFNNNRYIDFDSSDSPGARTSATNAGKTRTSNYGAHLYLWAGRYLP